LWVFALDEAAASAGITSNFGSQYNAPVHPPPAVPARRLALFQPHVLGTVCGLLSAAIYTCANGFLRAVHDCDPVWVSAVKAAPTVLAMSPVLAYLAIGRQPIWPTPRHLALIAGGALLGQLGGNVAFQYSLDKIGLALTVPLTLGGMIVFAAALGRVFLAEPVTPRAIAALSLLLSSIGVLALGANAAGQAMAKTAASPWELTLGVAAGCASGMFYAMLNVILRHCITQGTRLPTTLFTVSLVGLVTLGFWSWLRIGPSGILATRPDDLATMLAAGACNTVAFLALTKSLQLTSVVYVNALNATQATLAALAGVLIFQEARSPWLLAGVALTIGGLMLLARAHRQMQVPENLEGT
jgi:drug/metabolite transporter (DMT)-like permease